MKKALRLDCWDVKQILNSHPDLKGKKPIARGCFSAVFEGTRPNTVIKVTMDDIGYYMLNDGMFGIRGKHFPKVIKNHGEIGSIHRRGRNFSIYAFEMEKLEKLQTGSDARKIARKTYHATGDALRSAGYSNQCYDVLCFLKVPGIQRSLRNAINQLRDFANYFNHGAIDMHMGNFMQRKDGTLVITDPIANMVIYKQITGRLSP